MNIVIPFAHGIVGKRDIPIPDYVFGWAAGVVLVLSFVGLAVLWPKPILQPEPAKRLFFFPSLLVDIVCGVIGVALFVIVVYAGFAGVQVGTANLEPTFIYVTFWVGLAFASLLFGNVFGPFNPWRALARAVAWVGKTVSRGRCPSRSPTRGGSGAGPRRSGSSCFAWLELVYSNKDDPSTLSVLALAYAAIQLVGHERLRHRDLDATAATPSRSTSGCSAGWRRSTGADADALYMRAPLSALCKLDIVPGTVALLCAMIGSTSASTASPTASCGTTSPPTCRSSSSTTSARAEHRARAAPSRSACCS